MNKTTKILLAIIIVLTIALVIATYFCFKYLNTTLTCSNELYNVVEAIQNSGLELKNHEDGLRVQVKSESSIDNTISE